jgi:N-acetylglutamate synthase-like GNAT family acetyltransferase
MIIKTKTPERTKYIMVEDDNEVGELIVSHIAERNMAWILDLFIHKPYRNKGNAGKLLEAAIADYDTISLKPYAYDDSDQDKLVAFYKKYGFKEKGNNLVRESLLTEAPHMHLGVDCPMCNYHIKAYDWHVEDWEPKTGEPSEMRAKMLLKLLRSYVVPVICPHCHGYFNFNRMSGETEIKEEMPELIKKYKGALIKANLVKMKESRTFRDYIDTIEEKKQ